MTAVLTGAGGACTYSGDNIINGGTLAVDLSTRNDLLPNTAGTYLYLGGGTLNIKGRAGAISSQNMGNVNVTVNSGAGSIIINNNGATSTTLTLGSAWARAANNGGTLNINIATSRRIGEREFTASIA